MCFFKTLGGGKLLKYKLVTGSFFNSRANANYERAKSTGSEHNFKGEGEIKGDISWFTMEKVELLTSSLKKFWRLGSCG